MAPTGSLVRILTWVFFAFGVLATIMAIRTLAIAGIGYDALFEAGASLTNRSLPTTMTLSEAYEVAPITSEFYGVLLYQVAEVAHQVLTGAQEWMSPDDPSTYLWQNAVTLAYAVAASGAIAVATGKVLGSKLAGTFSYALLMSTPLWLGMSVLNYKDMPVAAGLTLISAGLMLGLGTHGRGWTLTALALPLLGSTIALGGRAGALPLVIAVPAATAVIAVLAHWRRASTVRVWPTVTIAIAAPVVGLVALWLTNPFARIDLPRWILDSIAISQQYVWVGVIRTAGQDLPSDQLPWWYAPAWLLATLPVLTTVFLIASLGALTVTAFRPGWGIGRRGLVVMAPAVIQSIFLPVALLATQPVLYDGIRHLLFLLPGLAAVMAAGLITITRGLTRSSWVAITALVVTAASLFAVVRWFPYQYAFINPIAGWDKGSRAWELDYWGVTAREGVERLAGEGLSPIAVIPASEPSRPFGGLTGEEVAVLAPPPQRSGIYAFLRWDSRIREEWCTVTFTITRDGQTLGQGGYCPK